MQSDLPKKNSVGGTSNALLDVESMLDMGAGPNVIRKDFFPSTRTAYPKSIQ